MALSCTVYWLLKYALFPFLIRNSSRLTVKHSIASIMMRITAFCAAIFILIEFCSFLFLIPEIKRLRTENPAFTSIMQFRGEPEVLKPGFIDFDQIPVALRDGVLACEDYDFYNHYGYSPVSIKFAFVQNFKHGSLVYGGSTITQQLARTLYLTPEKTFYRKYRELFITIEMELLLTKDRILELYMNYAEWGPGIYGISDASLYHFGKPVPDLERSEYASILSILPNPLKWDTVTFHQNEMLEKRWKQTCRFYGIPY
ncbi:MAG: transglycosylase domain-containing protein [Spirochaetales bacterium]|nr:transglycosylase domain-containing protein [Spirochaetales bacterium]